MNKKIAIMCVLPEEFEAIKAVFCFDDIQQETKSNNIWHASAAHQNYILAVSNIGCINASVNAFRLCRQYDIASILFCGIAGAICSSLIVGDVVISSNEFYVESVSHQSFAELWGTPNPDLPIRAINVNIKSYQFKNNVISQATVATSDVFPAPEQSLKACHDKNATIIDMETYPAAFVANHFNVSFYCVR